MEKDVTEGFEEDENVTVTDEFTSSPCKTRLNGRNAIAFDHREHGQWYVYFRALKYRVKYKPQEFRLEFKSTARYKSKHAPEPTFALFTPMLEVERIGWVHATKTPPTAKTILSARHLAQTEDTPVYLIHGGVQNPKLHEHANPVVVCQPHRNPYGGQRIIVKDCKVRFGQPLVLQDVLNVDVLRACLKAAEVKPGLTNLRLTA